LTSWPERLYDKGILRQAARAGYVGAKHDGHVASSQCVTTLTSRPASTNNDSMSVSDSPVRSRDCDLCASSIVSMFRTVQTGCDRNGRVVRSLRLAIGTLGRRLAYSRLSTVDCLLLFSWNSGDTPMRNRSNSAISS